ncbi:MAG: hypothetical protein R2751_13940 [Bacteroidales bacterium]
MFGELAFQPGAMAGILGLDHSVQDIVRARLLVHHYGPGYRGIRPTAYGRTRRMGPEQGLALHLEADREPVELPLHPGIVPFPSLGSGRNHSVLRYNLQVKHTTPSGLVWEVRYRNRLEETDRTANEPGTRPVGWEGSDESAWTSAPRKHPTSRPGAAYPGPFPGPSGFSFAQQFRVAATDRLDLSLQVVAFASDAWDQQLYVRTLGLPRSFPVALLRPGPARRTLW